MKTTRRHYVTFFSPGTFYPETTRKPIEGWRTDLAVTMAEQVVERYGAKPWGFQFDTYLEAEPVSDGHGGKLDVKPRLEETSVMHYLGGTITTLDEVEARNDPEERILRSNMSGNDMPIVIVVKNGYRSTQPFNEEHVVVGPSGEIVERGDDPKWVAYRASKKRAVPSERPEQEK